MIDKNLEERIDDLAGCVFRFPQAVSGDLMVLSRSITKVIEEKLNEIARRTERPEEH